VVTHFEQRDRAHPAGQVRLDRKARVALKQQPHRAVRHAQHDTVVVHVDREREPRAVGTQHVERDPVQLQAVTRARRAPVRPGGFDRREKREIERPGQGLAGLEDVGRGKRLDHRRQSAQVVGVAVARDHRRQRLDAVPPQERHDHRTTRVASPEPRAAVYHDPTTRRCA
jgi:hypothetical protein